MRSGKVPISLYLVGLCGGMVGYQLVKHRFFNHLHSGEGIRHQLDLNHLPMKRIDFKYGKIWEENRSRRLEVRGHQ